MYKRQQLVILVTAVLRDSSLLVKMCGKHFMQFRNIWLKRHGASGSSVSGKEKEENRTQNIFSW